MKANKKTGIKTYNNSKYANRRNILLLIKHNISVILAINEQDTKY